jgi:hypothetical protein
MGSVTGACSGFGTWSSKRRKGVVIPKSPDRILSSHGKRREDDSYSTKIAERVRLGEI